MLGPGCAIWLCSVATLSLAAAQPVVLVGFERDLAAEHVVVYGGSERVKEHATEGRYALRVDFASGGEKKLNGVLLRDLQVEDWAPYRALEFEVYNPNPFAIPLHVRIDLNDGGTGWGGVIAEPAKLTHVSVPIGVAWSSLSVKTVLLYNYTVELPKACSVFVDDFRLSGQAELKDIRPVKLADTSEEPPLSPEERARGYRLFHRSALDIVYAASKPRTGELLGELTVFGTPGEPEPVTIALRALQDLGVCRASVSDLVGPGGTRIPTRAIEVGTVRSLRKMWTLHGVPFYYESIPVFIQASASIGVLKDVTQVFWLTVRVPADSQPGSYRGAVRFEPEKGRATSLGLTLRVLPFRLDPVPKGKSFGVWYTTPWQKDRHAQYERDFQDIRDHGMTTVGLLVSPPLRDYRYGAGAVDLGWDGQSDFEMAVESYKRHGFPEPLVCLETTPMDRFASSFGDLDSGAYAKAFLDIMAAISQWARSHGWPEIIWQPVDEPSWHGEQAQHKALRLLHLLKSAGYRTEMDGRLDDWTLKALVGNRDVDVLTEHYFNLQQNYIDLIHRDGQKVQLYNWDETGFQPECMRQVPGLLAWKVGLDGTYAWVYQTLGGASQYDDLDAGVDTSLFYSPERGEIGGPSTGWEAYREGVKDYRYLQTLEASMRRLEASDDPTDKRLASECRAELGAVLGDVKVWRDKAYAGAFSAHWGRDYQTPTGQRYCEGPPPTFSGWPLGRFDEVRRQLASLIMKARKLT